MSAKFKVKGYERSIIMAYKVLSATTNNFTKKADCECYADTKAEANSGERPIGLPDGYEIEVGSIVRTGAWDVGTMQSDGTWGWS